MSETRRLFLIFNTDTGISVFIIIVYILCTAPCL